MWTAASIIISSLAMIAGFPTENNNPGINIVGGSETTPHEYPFISAIQRYGGNTAYQWCGASILDSTWILTAAHCITSIDSPSSFRIVAGDHDVTVEEGTEQRRSVEKIISHANFST
ncbi:unnamed protein product [Allacma fusca]|uniref:Peptidase S1 domain-containing protein n=1 Tax=Allacma fusca TaxID=39272 RepID=A0A8J2L0X6_9HEXA|nr:unnamed protein product [Allacma fusca]